MSKAPAENQRMQAIKPRPWDTVIDLSQQPSDWLTKKGKVRAKSVDRHNQRRAAHRADLKAKNEAALHARQTRRTRHTDFNPYHDPETGEFTSGEGGGLAGGTTRYHELKREHWEQAKKQGYLEPSQYAGGEIWTAEHTWEQTQKRMGLPPLPPDPDAVELEINLPSSAFRRPPGTGKGKGGDRVTRKRVSLKHVKAREATTPTPTSTGTHSYPKTKIGGTKTGAHPAKISPSVTSTKFATANSDNTYVQNDLAQMMRTEAHTVEVKNADGTVTEKGRFTANMDLMKNSRFYPGMRGSDLQGDAPKVARNAIEVMKKNMRFLLSKATAAQHGAVGWYRGARKLVDAKVRQYGLNDASVAGVFAALSPQKDWDQNIYLGNQVIDIYQTKQNHAWDDRMQAFADKLIADEAKLAAKKLAKTGKVKKTTPMVKMLPLIMNRTLAECDSAEKKGLWIRAYEEAHGDPEQNGAHGFRVYNPDGTFGAYHTNAPGKGETVGRVSKAGWNNTKMIGAAVASLEANGDRIKISAALSQVHKVRNFYNNILDPDGEDGDVTMDTHAIGAAWMQPYPGGAPAVSHGLANAPSTLPEGWEPAKDSDRFGSYGTYGMYAEAYRELAAEQKPPLLPNQMQAVIWVIKRDLFANTNDADDAAIEALWQSYNAGSTTHEQVLNDVWAIGERANARKQQS